MKVWTLPNMLTYLRILLIPCFVISFYLTFEHHEWLTAGIFIVASLTDWLDGFLARYLEQSSPLGAFLDPVADKLIVVAALSLLISAFPYFWMTIPAMIILAREIAVSALREWMAELGKRNIVKVGMAGKVKTTFQLIAIIILLSQSSELTWIVMAGMAMMYIAVFLTVTSMLNYMKAAWQQF